MSQPAKFVLDVHLGKLARHLRMLGFDSLWKDGYSDEEITRIHEAEGRIVLTRDRALLKNPRIRAGHLIGATEPREQAKEVLLQYGLLPSIRPFTVCLECNGTITGIEKDKVVEKIPLETQKYFNEFFTCLACGKIYWKGSHYDRMLELVEWLKKK